MKLAVKVLVQSLLLAALSCGIALAVNAVRSDGLDLVAQEPYQIYQPCPLMAKEASPVALTELEEDLSGLILVDSRKPEAFAQGHIPGARNIPFHALRSPKEEIVQQLRSAGPSKVLVYGDSEFDCGRLLAAEFAAAECLGVRYVEGGFPAWQAAGRPIEKGEGR